QFLVGRDGVDRDPAAIRGYARAAGAIGGMIERDAEPGRPLAHARADLGRALADARREHEAIEAAQDCGERAELTAYPPDEQIDRGPGARVVTREQRAHVVADPRHALQPALVVEHALDRVRVHAVGAHQMQHDARVERAAAG